MTNEEAFGFEGRPDPRTPETVQPDPDREARLGKLGIPPARNPSGNPPASAGGSIGTRTASFDTSDGIGGLSDVLIVDGKTFVREGRWTAGLEDSDGNDLTTVQTADLRRLVIAARTVAFSDEPMNEDLSIAVRELDAASEAFADSVVMGERCFTCLTKCGHEPGCPENDEPSDPAVDGVEAMIVAEFGPLGAVDRRDLAERIVAGLRVAIMEEAIEARQASVEREIDLNRRKDDGVSHVGLKGVEHRVCPRCVAILKPDATRCDECGAPIGRSS